MNTFFYTYAVLRHGCTRIFATIRLKFIEDVGLCFIRANSGDFVYLGKELRDLIDGFKDQIANKYGPPTRN